MKKTAALLLVMAGMICGSYRLQAQDGETFNRDGLTLHFKSNDPAFDPALKQRLVATFFSVYPLLSNEYNKEAAKEVSFMIDTAYDGVAATSGDRVVFNPRWFKKYPEDIDVVTHEVMHIVQDYGQTTGPGWLTEGIADYVRYKFGVNNPGANWALPAFRSQQSYTNSYRVTARFLEWLEKRGNKGIVKKLDADMRAHTYTAEVWKEETGQSLDELWKAYAANPAL
jgi:hypothetical protein